MEMSTVKFTYFKLQQAFALLLVAIALPFMTREIAHMTLRFIAERYIDLR